MPNIGDIGIGRQQGSREIIPRIDIEIDRSPAGLQIPRLGAIGFTVDGEEAQLGQAALVDLIDRKIEPVLKEKSKGPRNIFSVVAQAIAIPVTLCTEDIERITLDRAKETRLKALPVVRKAIAIGIFAQDEIDLLDGPGFGSGSGGDRFHLRDKKARPTALGRKAISDIGTWIESRRSAGPLGRVEIHGEGETVVLSKRTGLGNGRAGHFPHHQRGEEETSNRRSVQNQIHLEPYRKWSKAEPVDRPS